MFDRQIRYIAEATWEINPPGKVVAPSKRRAVAANQISQSRRNLA